MTYHTAFEYNAHRPWPLPDKKWRWRQQWNDLAFIHWSIDKDWLATQLPNGLELDLYDGNAWIGIVPFSMKGVTLRGFPAPKFLCDFPEINLRTYVTKNEKPGVWFFSLDVPNALAVWAARTFFHLPYYKAQIETSVDKNHIEYHFKRNEIEFDGTYTPGSLINTSSESFEYWSTERYCLYSANSKGELFRAEIHHPQWPLQSASIKIRKNTFLTNLPIGEMHPSVLFSKSIDVAVYDLEKLPH
jgi:uncharacterized protein YqjF (DUF2071 family)